MAKLTSTVLILQNVRNRDVPVWLLVFIKDASAYLWRFPFATLQHKCLYKC